MRNAQHGGLKSIGWLSELDYQVFAQQKDIKVETLSLTSRQKRIIAVILTVMPIILAAIGIMVWMKRTDLTWMSTTRRQQFCF